MLAELMNRREMRDIIKMDFFPESVYDLRKV